MGNHSENLKIAAFQELNEIFLKRFSKWELLDFWCWWMLIDKEKAEADWARNLQMLEIFCIPHIAAFYFDGAFHPQFHHKGMFPLQRPLSIFLFEMNNWKFSWHPTRKKRKTNLTLMRENILTLKRSQAQLRTNWINVKNN